MLLQFNWRLATQKDDPVIQAMCREFYREDPPSVPVSENQILNTLEKLRIEPLRGRALVLKSHDKILGYALLINYWSNELGGELLFVDELYVNPELRGKGLATQLMRELMNPKNELWPHPIVAIELEVSPKNDRARDLYLRLGFKAKRNSNLRFRIKN